jgi:predicted nucleic acid-binding protein
MKVLYDTNIILDVLLKRPGLADDSARAVTKAVNKAVQGFIAATSFNSIFYWAEKQKGRAVADEAVKYFLGKMEVCPVDRGTISKAINSDYTDFEDEIISSAAIENGIDAIVTRDKKGFKHTRGPRILSPAEFVAMF